VSDINPTPALAGKETEQVPERIPTTHKLATALEAAGAPPVMIARAWAGDYDEFKSTSSVDARTLLINDARTARLFAIAEQAHAGEFAAQDWEAVEWFNSPEGQATFAELVTKGKRKQAEARCKNRRQS